MAGSESDERSRDTSETWGIDNINFTYLAAQMGRARADKREQHPREEDELLHLIFMQDKMKGESASVDLDFVKSWYRDSLCWVKVQCSEWRML